MGSLHGVWQTYTCIKLFSLFTFNVSFMLVQPAKNVMERGSNPIMYDNTC